MDRNGSQILLLQDAGCSYENNGQTEWNLRYLQAKDLDAVCAICRESFPLDYPNSWFEEVVTGKYISFGLFHCDTLTSLLVAEVKRVSQCDAEDRDMYPDPEAPCVYILSLAVRETYRRKGIASLLLNHLLNTVVNCPPWPKIVFLHVLSENHGAIRFYKRSGFRHYSTLLNYYVIGNVYHDGHTFVLYTNGARPPFSLLELWNSVVGTVCHTFRCALRPKLFSR